MSRVFDGPCPYCKGKLIFGVGNAPCICTLGTGEPAGAITIRSPKLKKWRRLHPRHAAPADRPRTRAECAEKRAPGQPCPWIGCRWHVYLEVSGQDIRFRFPHLAPWDLPANASCVLDVAERGGLTLEEVGIIMNFTRERARQVEFSALATVRAELRKMKANADDND